MKVLYIRTPTSGRCFECIIDPTDSYAHLMENGAHQFLHDRCGAIPSFLFPQTEESESLDLVDLVCLNYGMPAFEIECNMEKLTIKGDEGEPDLKPYALFKQVGTLEGDVWVMGVYPYAITSFWQDQNYIKSVRLD